MSEPIANHARLLEPSELFEGWVIDLTEQGRDELIYFHNASLQGNQQILWQGNIYEPYPIAGKGFEKNASAQLPKPTLSVSDVGGIITSLCAQYDDCCDGLVTRKLTFREYMDKLPDGSDNPNYDPLQSFPDEVWKIERKAAHVAGQVVSFALSATIDSQGQMLPGRASNAFLCGNIYRSGDGCSWAGVPVADDQDNVFIDIHDEQVIYLAGGTVPAGGYIYKVVKGVQQFYVAKVDVPTGTALSDSNFWTPERCGKRLHSCELRFGVGEPLDTSACPGMANLP